MGKGKNNKIIIALLVLIVLLAAAGIAYRTIKTPKVADGAKNGTEDTSRTAETEPKEDGIEKPLCTLVFVSDYQAEPGFPEPSDTFTKLLRAVKANGVEPGNVIVCGDYTNDENLYDYQLSPDGSIEEVRDIIRSECPGVSQDDVIFVQGNHDALTDAVSESGLHEYGDYLVYVLNTQYDFPWKQGRDTDFRDRVIAASEEMEKCFDRLSEKGETRPVFIAGHVPLHFTARTSSRHVSGDNMYSRYVFDAVNDAAKDLDIIYLFGHNHSKGWDCYFGGACIYRAPGETILIPDAEDGAVNTDEYTEEKLDFTYMNAGYTGYYMNCGPEELEAGEADRYHAADEALTCTVAEIYDDCIVITRYDAEGGHVLGAAGEADPYKGGIDEGLIGPEHYSRETAGPATIKRSSVFKNGTIKTDVTDDEEDGSEEKDAA